MVNSVDAAPTGRIINSIFIKLIAIIERIVFINLAMKVMINTLVTLSMNLYLMDALDMKSARTHAVRNRRVGRVVEYF